LSQRVYCVGEERTTGPFDFKKEEMYEKRPACHNGISESYDASLEA